MRFFLFATLLLSLLPQASFAENNSSIITPPTGPYAVGTTQYIWTDSERAETYTLDSTDHRKVAVQIWYPAQTPKPPLDQNFAPYVLNPKEFALEPGYARVEKIVTHSYLDADLIPEKSLPVLICNHGGMSFRFSSTFLIEELASHGFVVVSIEHNGFNTSTNLPDSGDPVKWDNLEKPIETGDLYKDAVSNWDFLTTRHFPIWMADNFFVLKKLEELAHSDKRFKDRLNLKNMGAWGWSFGGATAMQLLKDDSRISAAVDLDGQQFGDVSKTGVSKPFLLMHSGYTEDIEEEMKNNPTGKADMEKLIKMARDQDLSLLDLSKADRYELTLKNAQHITFSDWFLLVGEPQQREQAISDQKVIRAYTREFFQKYLLNIESEELQYPLANTEIEFRVY